MNALSLLTIGRHEGLVLVDLSRTACLHSSRMHYRVNPH